MPNWKKLIVSGSDANLNSLVVSGQVTASSYKGDGSQLTNINTASYSSTASAIQGGTVDYIPLWKTGTSLSSSLLYQTASSVLLGATTQHTPEAPDRFGIFAGVTDSYNLVSAHGEIDSYLQLNVKNFSGGPTASSDIVATADVGSENAAFIDLGINSSGYSLDGGLGGPLDAYLYTTGSDLLIGNLSPDKRIVLFTGPGNAVNNARVYIDPTGSVGINTSSPTPGAPEALIVNTIGNSYNLITGKANTDNYVQVNIKNSSNGIAASADYVATADNGNETTNYIDMGINSSQFAGSIGGANDAYLYSTGNMLHIGNASANQDIMFFAGGPDAMAYNKLTLAANNQHSLSGSLNITGSTKITENLTVGGTITAEKFVAEYVTSSIIYESGSTKFGDTADDVHQFTGSLQVLGTISGSLILPSGIISSSTQASNWTVLSASFATSASYAPTSLPGGVVSSSTQASGWTVLSSSFATTASAATSITFTPTTASFATTASAATSITFTPTTASFATTSSFAQNSRLLNNTASAVFATTGSNVYTGTQTISGSLLLNSDIVVFSGSFTTSGSFAITGSLGVTSGITGSLLGSSSFATTASAATSITFTPSTASFATTASAATSITFTPTTASFATTASAATSITFTPSTASFATTSSFAQNARLLNNTGSLSFATTGSNTFNGNQIITGSLITTTDIVIFSGSFTTSGSFTVTGSLGVTGGITASLLGSSSFATTASAATSITFTPSTASFATTASAATSITFTPTTSSFSQNAQLLNNTASSVFATTGSNTFVGNQRITGSLVLSSSLPTELQVIGDAEITGSLRFLTGGITGSLFGTSSWAFNSISSSFATTASTATSITFTPTSASFATTASAATSITFTPVSASYALTASFIDGGFY